MLTAWHKMSNKTCIKCFPIADRKHNLLHFKNGKSSTVFGGGTKNEVRRSTSFEIHSGRRLRQGRRIIKQGKIKKHSLFHVRESKTKFTFARRERQRIKHIKKDQVSRYLSNPSFRIRFKEAGSEACCRRRCGNRQTLAVRLMRTRTERFIGQRTKWFN